jgi:hypothetical protein
METYVSRCFANCSGYLTQSDIEMGMCLHCGTATTLVNAQDLEEYIKRQD